MRQLTNETADNSSDQRKNAGLDARDRANGWHPLGTSQGVSECHWGISCPGGLAAGSNSWYPEPWTSSKGDSSGAKARHGNQTRVNVLFYDGSVRTALYRDLRNNVSDIFGHFN
jgi:prepilin-type processing-associated H-X9-DG protein